MFSILKKASWKLGNQVLCHRNFRNVFKAKPTVPLFFHQPSRLLTTSLVLPFRKSTMNNNNSQLLPGSQNDEQNDPQTVTVSTNTAAPGHPMPSSTFLTTSLVLSYILLSVETYPPMPVQFGTPDSDGMCPFYPSPTSTDGEPPKNIFSRVIHDWWDAFQFQPDWLACQFTIQTALGAVRRRFS